MRIFCPNCGKEIQNKEVYINPCIKCEKIDGKDYYFAVADVRTMCEKCGEFIDELGVSAEIPLSDISDFIRKQLIVIDEFGECKRITGDIK